MWYRGPVWGAMLLQLPGLHSWNPRPGLGWAGPPLHEPLPLGSQGLHLTTTSLGFG